jgi:hypothetical protein
MSRVLLTLAFVALAAPCLADNNGSPLSLAFGNTILSTYPDGRTAELWLSPDGSYTAEGRQHDRSRGSWSIKDDRLCLKQAHPFAFGYVYCTPLRSAQIGSSWSGTAVTGEPILIRLVRGRIDPADQG